MTEAGRSPSPILRFLGAAGTVTGSRFLLSTGAGRVMVDCGLFQGLKELRLRNWDPLPLAPAGVESILLSHAHLDHSGYLPLICRDGFRGRVLATPYTRDLCRILLPDSGHLQEEEADYANERGYSKHAPARPLYTEEDALNCLDRFDSAEFDSPVDCGCEVRATFRHAGHILGASSILLETPGPTARRILFSGDLGRPYHPILVAPAPVPPADIVVVESTYGDRTHDDAASLRVFEDAIRRTAKRGGVTIIPSFAVDRTEVVLFHLRKLVAGGRIPALPVYVDSPMALAALRLYRAAVATRANGIVPGISLEDLEPPGVSEVRTKEESIALNAISDPAIIISASGMATGGRVLHHLANRLPDPRNTVILVGYQAEGTRGRLMLDGAASVKMLGRYVEVRAEIVNVAAFSVHADQHEIIQWLRTAPHRPYVAYVVHGDPPASEALRAAIQKELKWTAVVPRHLEQVRLD